MLLNSLFGCRKNTKANQTSPQFRIHELAHFSVFVGDFDAMPETNCCEKELSERLRRDDAMSS